MTQKGREGAERNEEWREEGAEKGATQRSIKSDKREIDYPMESGEMVQQPSLFASFPACFPSGFFHRIASVPKAV